MKERLCAFLFAVWVAAIAYIMVSTAAAHTNRDTAALNQWRYENAVRP